jgi:hypothetical protein
MCNEAREDAKHPTTSIALCKKWLMKLNCSVSVVGFNYFDPTKMLNWKKTTIFQCSNLCWRLVLSLSQERC